MTSDEIRRGDRAAALLDDELVKEAIATLKAETMSAWAESPARDHEGRERLWVMYRLAERFESHLKAVMEGGKIARKRIADIETEKRFSFLNR